MPYLLNIQAFSLRGKARETVLREAETLRKELTETRSALMSMRALLVAGTAPGVGYNTPATDLGAFTPNAAASPERFTRT